MRVPSGRSKVVVASVLALAVAVLAVGEVRAHAFGRPPTSGAIVAPKLGPIRTVDKNDVGDPFILTVPAGIDPPSGLPYTDTGPDAYVSARWTPASASTARRNGWYVLFGTTDWQSNVPTAVSTDRVNWTQAPDALPQLPAWAEPSISMTWAPAALHVGDSWILYFSTEEAASQLECVGRAVSAHPAGPYSDDSSQPMLCQRALGGSIDPSVISSGGADYLLWKNDGNSSSLPDFIWSQQLTRDGLSLTGDPHRLLGSAAAWTRGIVEAPAMVPSPGGGYWLFYAGGGWDSNTYGTGVARCTTVIGPCAAAGNHPFLATSGKLISPGGLDTFTARDGRVWAAFTALVLVPSTWHPGRYYYNRVLDIAPILTR
ncbi:MAG TPA: glycoside hydrolase family 43 protein [Acidimicrobiales bacterium]|nr:glycoside hydrolase family 43 protein [Acidimicrobiales bacterium]